MRSLIRQVLVITTLSAAAVTGTYVSFHLREPGNQVFVDVDARCAWKFEDSAGGWGNRRLMVDLWRGWVHFPLAGYPGDEYFGHFPHEYTARRFGQHRPLPPWARALISGQPEAVAAVRFNAVGFPSTAIVWQTEEVCGNYLWRPNVAPTVGFSLRGIFLDAGVCSASIFAGCLAWKLGRTVRRVRRGCCGHCGYPLATSQQRCPECGRDRMDLLKPANSPLAGANAESLT